MGDAVFAVDERNPGTCRVFEFDTARHVADFPFKLPSDMISMAISEACDGNVCLLASTTRGVIKCETRDADDD